MFFTEKNRKKNLTFLFLALFLFSGVIFAFSNVHTVFAADRVVCPIDGNILNCMKGNAGIMAGNALDTAAYPFKLMLYGLFVLFGWMASLAITLFEWVIKPENISGATGVLNQPVVYEMWKFIRDFFNLFFILILLYIAFMVIFQIDKNFKKTLLSLVLAALYINFSFPVSRALIDVTNVPMYFFANQMAAKEGGETTAFGQVMTASKLQNILLPKDVGLSSTEFDRIFVAVIFLFLFAVTLLVLAVMFIVRLVALVILVIFSPVGFAASIVPGLSSYSKMWWDNFWKYAFFGPAAMLMLLVSVRFFSALGDEKTGIFKSLTTVASGTVASEPTFFASMALFSVPIIMLWMAMGLAQTFSIKGAGSVVGMGQKFSKWAGGKASGLNAIKRNYASYTSARKSRDDAKNKNNFGSRFGGGFNKKQDTIYGAMGLPGSKVANQRVNDAKNKEIYEKVDANKKNGIGDEELKKQLKRGNKIEAASAAISLSERKAIATTDDFALALKALGGNTKEVSALIDKAGSGAMKMTGKDYQSVLDSDAFKNRDGSLNTGMKDQLNDKIAEKGQAKVLVDYEISMDKSSVSPDEKIDKAVTNVLTRVKSAKDRAASESLFADPVYGESAVNFVEKQGPDSVQSLKKASGDAGTSVGSQFVEKGPSSAPNDEGKRMREKIQQRKKENKR